MKDLVKRVLFSAIITASAIIPSGCSLQNKNIIDTYSKGGMYHEVSEFYNSKGKLCTFDRGIPEQGPIGKTMAYLQLYWFFKLKGIDPLKLKLDLERTQKFNQEYLDPKNTIVHHPPYSNPSKP